MLPLERLQHRFDRDSRRTWRRRSLAGMQDEHYRYAGLSQVKQSAIAAVPVNGENCNCDLTSECELEFAFQGQFLDTESGLLNYGYRYYSLYLGRWTAKDPIGIEGGLNLYGMTANKLINMTDFLGQQRSGTAVEVVKNMVGPIMAGGGGPENFVVDTALVLLWMAALILDNIPPADLPSDPYPFDPQRLENYYDIKEFFKPNAMDPDHDENNPSNLPDSYFRYLLQPMSKALEGCEDQWDNLTGSCPSGTYTQHTKDRSMENCMREAGFDYVGKDYTNTNS